MKPIDLHRSQQTSTLVAGSTATADMVLADDGSGTTSDACEPLTNAGAVSGKIALVDRGSCAFVLKVKNAQNAGAVGAVVANNDGSGLINMAGFQPLADHQV